MKNIELNIFKNKMRNSKKIKEKGKIRFSNYFREFKEGERVAVIRELSVPHSFPKKLQGRSGKISNKRGKCYLVKINDLNKEKNYIIHPVHLRKLK